MSNLGKTEIIDIDEINEKSGKNNRKKKIKFFKKLWFKIVFSMFALGVTAFLFILYGPWNGFRNWLITTAMTTLNHQYLATIFYSDEVISEVLNGNTIVDTGEITDPNLVNTNMIDFSGLIYANKYEQEILTKDEGNDLYKIIEIEGKGFSGYLVAVYDSSKIHVATTARLGVSGQYLTTMSKNNNAVLAINGGGFIDPDYNSTGGVPEGITIVDGKVVASNEQSGSSGLIGFDNNNKLILGRMSATEALNRGVRDAVTFGPFLIINGVPSFIRGNGGWGTAPRTAIGQRQDGIVLFLVIDGRTLTKPGADMVDLTEIMTRYGAYNAANLDGGTSSNLVVNGQLINHPVNGNGENKTRPIATGFMVVE